MTKNSKTFIWTNQNRIFLNNWEPIIFESGHLINVFNDQKPILSRFTNKGNFSPVIYTAQMPLTKVQKFRIVYTKGIILAVAAKLGRSCSKKAATEPFITQKITSAKLFLQHRLIIIKSRLYKF